MRVLFERVAVPVAVAGTPGAWLGRRRLMAIDGVIIDLPDTPARAGADNRQRFPKATGGTRRPFPQLRAVGLSECSTHVVVAASLGSIRTGERELAGQLLDSITDDMLIIADRGFFSYQMWAALCLASSSDDSGLVLVAHPFHPLSGQRLEVLTSSAMLARDFG